MAFPVAVLLLVWNSRLLAWFHGVWVKSIPVKQSHLTSLCPKKALDSQSHVGGAGRPDGIEELELAEARKAKLRGAGSFFWLAGASRIVVGVLKERGRQAGSSRKRRAPGSDV
ncbi:hypothetical protein B0T19DRAFT_485681 [Cercophora scortea]|uniref:Secreted protein n=1 Tax=Cercophora scortea TaxID=314031 RepID=A0AAE0IDT7_9PEZI|nr:hypothetical protein B0T19DRAFT_485681 [Cercophora scortea]